MSSFDACDLISLWEMDPGLPPADKAAHLLRLLCPPMSGVELDSIPIGQRDRALLRARRELFGDAIEAAATCVQCAAELDVSLRVSDFLAGHDGDADEGADTGAAAAPASTPSVDSVSSIDLGGVTFEVRPATAGDAVYVSRTADPAAARGAMVERCVIGARRGGEPVAVADVLDEAALTALASYLEALDPLAEIRLKLGCGECGHGQSVAFDIGAYLWNELRGEAERLLDEVCALARAYGWREADILAMSGERRKRYLERSA